MKPSQKRPVIGGHLYDPTGLGQSESFDHLLGESTAMSDPGFRLSTEIRIIGVEEDVSPDEVFCLHQPTGFADENPKRKSGLRSPELLVTEVGIGQG